MILATLQEYFIIAMKYCINIPERSLCILSHNYSAIVEILPWRIHNELQMSAIGDIW